MSLDYLAAFIIGLLGSGHCIGMCGGINTMLTSALPQGKYSHQQQIPTNTATTPPFSPHINKLILVLGYHLGRITSYCIIGAVVGFTGSIAAKNIGSPLAVLRMVSAIFMILLGLYIGQWLMWLNRVEAIGKRLWQYISPFTQKVIPVNNLKKAVALGLLWGWLPCGLIYSVLTWSLASGSLYAGAATMLFFGLGTLPALLTLSLSVNSINNLLVKPSARKLIAFLLISFGIYSFVVAYQQMF